MPYNFDEVRKKLNRLGFEVVRQRGSHVIFSNGQKTFPVPRHGGRDISPGVEKQILRILEIFKEEFRDIK